jgi:hypothetical protein
VAWVSERTIPTERQPLVGEVSANFCGLEGCRVVSVTDPWGGIRGFLDRSRYFFFQVAPQLYWVDPVPDPLFLRKSGSARNRTRTSGSVARNSDRWTTEAVNNFAHTVKISVPPLNLDTCRSSQPHHAIVNEEHPKRFPGRCSLVFYFLHSAGILKGERRFLNIKVTRWDPSSLQTHSLVTLPRVNYSFLTSEVTKSILSYFMRRLCAKAINVLLQ